MHQEPRPLAEMATEQLEALLSDGQTCVQELEEMDPAQLSEQQRSEREETLSQGYQLLEAIELELIHRQLEELKTVVPTFIERMKRVAAAKEELTQRWGYQDRTAQTRTEYAQHRRQFTDLDTQEPPRFLCVLQTPGGDTVFCFKTAQLFDELDKARAGGQEYTTGAVPKGRQL